MKQKMNIITAIAIMMTLLFGLALVPAKVNAEEPATDPNQQTTQTTTDGPTNPERFLPLEGKQKGANINLKWGKLPEVSVMKVYGGYVGSSMKCLKVVKNNASTSATIKKLNKKKINTRKVFKFKLLAYKNVNGKDTLMCKSPVIYIAGARHMKYTNAKTLKVTKNSFTIQKDGTAKIKGKLTPEKKKKDYLPSQCGPKFSFFSTNKNVATVDLGGNITGVAPGTCTVYVYTHNGKNKKVNVTVQ